MVEYEQATEISPDHCGIIIKINMEINKINEEIEKEIKDIIIEEIDISNVNETKENMLREKIKEYAEIKLAKDYKRIDINKVGIVMEKIYQDAKEILGTRKRIQNKQKGIERNEEVRKLDNQLSKLTRVVRSYVPNNKVTKKMKAIIENEEKYRPKKLIKKKNTFNNIQEIIEVKKEIIEIIKKITKDIQTLTRKLTGERIKKYIEQINNNENNKPGDFFRKCNYDKATNIKSQITKIEKKEGENTKIISKNEEVKEEIKDFWKEIFKTRKKEPEKETLPDWLNNNKTKEIKDKITKESDKIGEAITKEEIQTMIKKLKKEKASGKDRIPGEIIKIMAKEEDIIEYIQTLYNEVKDKNIKPDEWRRNVIFTIYKSGNPYQPKNYRPITLMNIIYKVYISIINRRLTDILEKTNTLSNAQAGFRENRNTWQKYGY